MALMRDLRLAKEVGRKRWLALGRAALELGIARLRLRSRHTHRVMNAARARPAAAPRLSPVQAQLVDEVAFAIPRVAVRLPWRADCLVQALAAERWLRRSGIAATLVIGVDKDGAAALDAHAWLQAGDRIVTGGDVARFAPLSPDRNRGG